MIGFIHTLYKHHRALSCLKKNNILKYFVDLGMYDEIEYLLTKLPAGKEVGKLLDIVLGKSTKTLNIDEKNRSISVVQSDSLPSENSNFTSDPDQKFKICEILINHFSKMKFRMLGHSC